MRVASRPHLLWARKASKLGQHFSPAQDPLPASQSARRSASRHWNSCGAAGVLAGRWVTTHWSPRHLMPYYGAVPVDARVTVDGNIISAAGVTAGLDAALALVSLMRGDRRA
jgi:hypothetical protein